MSLADRKFWGVVLNRVFLDGKAMLPSAASLISVQQDG
jgi:hypothetical protein